MSRKALKVVVELSFRAVSCPGVHLAAKHDVCLSMCFMGQYRQSESLPAVFPLLFHEKMTFEKARLYETVGVELVQLIPPVGDTLACFEEDARTFLFPEPKLVPSFSGVDREVLMTRAPHFPGIAPRLEFSTKTTITECSPDAEINFYPNVPLRKVLKKNRRRSSRPRTTSPHQKQIQNLGRNRGGRVEGERRSIVRPSSHRSQSLSPLRTGNIQRLARLSLESTPSSTTSWNKSSNNQPVSTYNTLLLEIIHALSMIFNQQMAEKSC
uniref:Spermatogenesis associated 6-like n=1 Tax=Acanthochromis polyacanthus TaxID=80966 RepID=A0A3Q1HAE5_9TELE